MTPSGSLQQGGVFPLDTPLATDATTGWKLHPCFKGGSRNAKLLSCHASALVPGKRPHPPHRHEDEEFLLVLAGCVDLILPEGRTAGEPERRHLTTGEFAYYPAGFPHTIEAAGTTTANYLMLKWADKRFVPPAPLAFKTGTTRPPESTGTPCDNFSSKTLLEGATLCLEKFNVHLSEVAPGGGYGAHQDDHEVILVLLEGEIETAGKRARPHGVVYHAAGESHGMANPGTVPARYLVLELRGHKAAKRLAGTVSEFIKAHAQNEYHLWTTRLKRLIPS